MTAPSAPVHVAYITCPSAEEADRIAAALVGEGLAACTNHLPGMRSCYRWQGAIEHGAESVLIAKTTAAQLPALVARVRELHSDEVPCVTSWPLTGGNDDYLRWVTEQLGG